MEHNLVFPTYEEIHEKSVKLAELIKDKNINFTKMVVVSRGGFVPASVVAYCLGIQDVDIVSIQSYIHREPGEAFVHRAPKTDEVVLVIDDIINFNSSSDKPKFIKTYVNIEKNIISAIKNFNKDVKNKKFPSKRYSY